MTKAVRQRRNSRSRWIFLLLLVLAALYLSRTYYKRSITPEYPPNAFYKVKRADMLISIVEEGSLRALNETIVRSGLDGFNRIIHLVPEGAQVKKGELLVELDSAALKDRLNELELSYQERLFQLSQASENVKIQKSLAESEIKDAELILDNAESDLEKFRDGDSLLLIKTINARIGVLQEQVRIAEERATRTVELFKTDKATRSEMEADQLILKREQLALSQYQEDLRLIKKYDHPNQLRLLESKVVQAKEDLGRLKQQASNELAQAEADLRTSKRTVDVMEDNLEMQKRRVELAKIFAPQDGLVVYAEVSPFVFYSGGDVRRDSGRMRVGGRGGSGSGEFRGGRGRGGGGEGRGGGSASSSGSSGSGGQSASTGNGQSSATAAATDAASAGGAGSLSASGGSGARGGGGTGAGGGSIVSVSSAFVSYPSMRQASTLGASNGTSQVAANSGASSLSSGSDSEMMTASSTALSQFPTRSQSFGQEVYYGSPGILSEGTMVRQRQELIRLPDVSKMLAEIRIHESRVRQVKAGMPAFVEIDNLPGQKFKASVRRIALLPDAQMRWMNPDLKVFPTDILIEDELPELKPGVTARAEIIITNLSKVLSVPIQTVARVRGNNVCFVKKDSGVAAVPVVTGWFNEEFIQIVSGLNEGDLVLLAPLLDEPVEEEKSASTNEVQEPVETPLPPDEPVETPEREERRFQRPAADVPAGEAPPSERRSRRRPPNAAEGEAPAGERSFQRRNSDSPEGGTPSEGRRSRPPGQGRRPAPTPQTPE